MALARLFLVSTHCLLHSSALITQAQDDEFSGNRAMALVGRARGAAGCFNDETTLKLRTDGVLPVEDLKRILNREVELVDHHGPACQEANNNITWCKEPRTDPLLGTQDQEWYAELLDYLKNKLAPTDNTLPIVAAAYDQPITANARSAQIMNFVCGFSRLGMSKRFVLFANSQLAYDSYVHHFPNVTVVFHPHITKFAQAMAERSNVRYFNRIMKLAVAQMVLDSGRDVVITDTDISWIRDSSELFHKSGLDFAAMLDCPAINSGFVYYRNVPQTRDLLHMALSTWRESWFCGDNDQYVLNCGWMRAAIKGLNYRVLPSNSWSGVCSGNVNCRCTDDLQVLNDTFGRQKAGIGDGYLWAYHTYGMSGPYMKPLDMLAAMDLVDVDFKTGQCKKGPKMITADIMARHCSTREDGITHALCVDNPLGQQIHCQTDPFRAEAIVADFESRSVPIVVAPP